MKPIVTINWEKAPHDWKKFQKWHALACAASDPLTAEERFLKEGGVIDDVPRTAKKK
jgi:hypothetical protein